MPTREAHTPVERFDWSEFSASKKYASAKQISTSVLKSPADLECMDPLGPLVSGPKVVRIRIRIDTSKVSLNGQ